MYKEQIRKAYVKRLRSSNFGYSLNIIARAGLQPAESVYKHGPYKRIGKETVCLQSSHGKVRFRK